MRGIWGPTVGAMAGVPIPLVAVQHQLVWTDPIPELAGLRGDTWAQQPVVRHQDMSLYFRQRDDHYGVGNYRHEPIVTPQASIRRPGGPMQPSLMPFTPEDFDLCEAETARMFPALAGRMRPSDPARSLNGMFSFTPDAGSVVGESSSGARILAVRGGVGDARGGMARQVAEWMVGGEPELRFGGGRREPVLSVPDVAAVRARTREAAVPRGLRHHPPAAAALEPAG